MKYFTNATWQDLDNILSRLYHKGQLVSCIVMQIDDDRKETAKRKIWLSLRLSLLHKSLTLDAIQEGMVCKFREWNTTETEHVVKDNAFTVFVLCSLYVF